MVKVARADGGARRAHRGRRMVSAAVLLMVAAAAVSCGGDDEGLEKNAEGFHIEPAAEVGPHAFTPSVVTNENAAGLVSDDGGESAQGASTQACDTTKFLTELQSRPDAYREWAKVLGLKQEAVPAYIKGLKSTTLTKDTKVTNHGLKDGKAYPRQSVLVAGTQVLVAEPGSSTGSTTTSSSPPATAPGGVIIVTRCKCGNPLLGPGNPKEGDEAPPATETPGTTPGSTPGTVKPAATTSTSAGATSTTRSGSTTTRAGGTAPPSSAAG